MTGSRIPGALRNAVASCAVAESRADAEAESIRVREAVDASGRTSLRVLLFANTDWYLYNFRLALAQALRDSGAEVVLVSPPGAYGPRLQEHGFRWIAVPMKRRSLNPFREVLLVRSLVALYRAERPDIAHHFTIKCVVYGSLAARWARVVACVNAVAGMGYVFSSRSVLAGLLRPLLKTVLRYLLRSGGPMRLILQNFDDRAVFLSLRLARPVDVRVIRGSGVDTKRFHPRRPRRRARKRHAGFCSRRGSCGTRGWANSWTPHGW